MSLYSPFLHRSGLSLSKRPSIQLKLFSLRGLAIEGHIGLCPTQKRPKAGRKKGGRKEREEREGNSNIM